MKRFVQVIFFLILATGAAVVDAQQKVVVIPLVTEMSSSPAQKFYSVPPAAFQRVKDVDYGLSITSLGLGSLDCADEMVKYLAPVYLPHGAKVTELSANLGQIGLGASLTLWRVGPGSETTLEMVTVTSETAINPNIDGDVIDNLNYHYSLELDLGCSPPATFYKAVIKYSE